MIRRLTSGPKPFASGAEVVGDELTGASVRETVFDAVVAGEVGAALGRGDDVVRGQAVFRVRQRDLLYRGAGGFHVGDRFSDACGDAGLHAVDEILPGKRDAAATQVRGSLVVAVGDREQLPGDGDRSGGGVALVTARNRVEEHRGVAGVAGERPDLVERAGEGDDAVSADPAVRRLEAHDAAQRRRLADATARVRAYSQRGVV